MRDCISHECVDAGGDTGLQPERAVATGSDGPVARTPVGRRDGRVRALAGGRFGGFWHDGRWRTHGGRGRALAIAGVQNERDRERHPLREVVAAGRVRGQCAGTAHGARAIAYLDRTDPWIAVMPHVRGDVYLRAGVWRSAG